MGEGMGAGGWDGPPDDGWSGEWSVPAGWGTGAGSGGGGAQGEAPGQRHEEGHGEEQAAFTHQFSGALVSVADVLARLGAHGSGQLGPHTPPGAFTARSPLRLMALPPPPDVPRRWDHRRVWYAERPAGPARPSAPPPPGLPPLRHGRGSGIPVNARRVAALPPGGVGAGAIRLRLDMERAMAVLANLPVGAGGGSGDGGPTARVHLLSLVQYTQRVVYEHGYATTATGLGLTRVPQMPDHHIAMLFAQGRRLMLHPRLASDAREAHSGIPIPLAEEEFVGRLLTPGAWENVLETSTLGRLIAGIGFLLWYAWDELTSAALGVADPREAVSASMRQMAWAPSAARAIGFAPRAYARARFDAGHARYYTLLVKKLSILLASHATLDAQTAAWLGAHEIVSFHPQRRRQRLMQAATQRGVDPQMMWRQYVEMLATWNLVPPPLIESRLAGDWPVTSLDDYARLSQALCASLPELAAWRQAAAQHWNLPARDLLLWLGEPMPLLPQG